MSNPANEIQEITTAQFEKLLKEQTPEHDTQKLTNLEINKICTVTNTKLVDTPIGKSMILSFLNNGDVWAPEDLKIKSLTVIPYMN